MPRCPAPRDLVAGASALSSARWLTPCRARPEGPEQQEASSCLQEFAAQEGKVSLGTGSSAVGVRGSNNRRARGPSPPAPDAVPSIATSSLPNARSDIPPGDGLGHVGPRPLREGQSRSSFHHRALPDRKGGLRRSCPCGALWRRASLFLFLL